jgi:hypothetical protein
VLRVALAAVHQTALTISVNDPEVKEPIYDSGIIGNDNALARASDHGDYLSSRLGSRAVTSSGV